MVLNSTVWYSQDFSSALTLLCYCAAFVSSAVELEGSTLPQNKKHPCPWRIPDNEYRITLWRVLNLTHMAVEEVKIHSCILLLTISHRQLPWPPPARNFSCGCPCIRKTVKTQLEFYRSILLIMVRPFIDESFHNHFRPFEMMMMTSRLPKLSRKAIWLREFCCQIVGSVFIALDEVSKLELCALFSSSP